MMRKYTLFLCCFIAFSTQIRAQVSGIVRGSVKDKNTQEAIIGAVVSVEGSTMATTTDVEGNYKLVLPVGAYNLRPTLLGYTPLILHNINVTSGNA